MKTMPPSIELGQVDKSISRALTLLRQTYRSSPDGGGWYHQLAMHKPGPTATALGLSAFLECEPGFEHFEDGLRFLAQRQLQSENELIRGGWALNTSSGRPVVEATGWVVRFLGMARCGQLKSAPSIELGYQWLLANQNPDGGWGSLRGAPSRVWLTCLALRGLVQIDPYSKAVERGVEWLMSQQGSEPAGWGEMRGRGATATHTAMSLLAISEARPGWSDNRVLNAYEWLEMHLDTANIDDQHARVESYNVSASPNDDTLLWHTILLHYGLPTAMSALMRHPAGPQGGVVLSGYKTIIRTQLSNGAWRNIQGGTDASIWALWPFIQALVDLKKLPLSRAGDVILWGQDVIVVQRAGGKPDALIELVRAKRRRAIQHYFARYWSTLLVMLSVLAGLVLVGMDSIELKDYLLGLIVPVALLGVQEYRSRKREQPAPT